MTKFEAKGLNRYQTRLDIYAGYFKPEECKRCGAPEGPILRLNTGFISKPWTTNSEIQIPISEIKTYLRFYVTNRSKKQN